MIDATKLCQQGRRQNEFSQQNIMDNTVHYFNVTVKPIIV